VAPSRPQQPPPEPARRDATAAALGAGHEETRCAQGLQDGLWSELWHRTAWLSLSENSPKMAVELRKMMIDHGSIGFWNAIFSNKPKKSIMIQECFFNGD